MVEFLFFWIGFNCVVFLGVKQERATNGEVATNGPPKALVKPQVLTHVIEGFVIQEGSFPSRFLKPQARPLCEQDDDFYFVSASEPFPVGRTADMGTGKTSLAISSDDEPPSKLPFLLQTPKIIRECLLTRLPKTY